LVPRVGAGHGRVSVAGIGGGRGRCGGGYRNLGGGGAGLVVVAGGVVAVVEVVDVPRGGEVVQRIVRLVREPLREVVAPGVAAERDDLRGSGVPDRGDHLLHTRGGVGDARARATVSPARPADPIGLVVGLEDDAGGRLEGVRHGRLSGGLVA